MGVVDGEEEPSLTGTASPVVASTDKTNIWEIISTDLSLGRETVTKKLWMGCVQRERMIVDLGGRQHI